MWTTLDGYILRLPQARLKAMTSQLPLSGLRHLVRGHYTGSLRGAVLGTIGQLARQAHRAGNLYRMTTPGPYPVFTARVDGSTYDIITRPLTRRQHAIVMIRPQPAEGAPEFELRLSGQATVTFDPQTTLAAAISTYDQPNPPQGRQGIYIIERWDGTRYRPHYIGEGDLATRIRVHRDEIRSWSGAPLSQYRVRVGHVTSPPGAAGTLAQNLLGRVQKVLMRKARRSMGRLQGNINDKAYKTPFRVPQGQTVQLTYQDAPDYLRDRRRRGSTLVIPGGSSRRGRLYESVH